MGGAGTVGWMERLRPYPVAAFTALTLFIWLNRIWLAWTNPGDSVGQKLVWTLPIALFVVPAVGVVVAYLGGVDSATRGFRRLVRVFAGTTIAYWAVRLPMIAAADHPMGFKLVHTVLAVVSVAAAIAAWRSLDRARSLPSGTPVPA